MLKKLVKELKGLSECVKLNKKYFENIMKDKKEVRSLYFKNEVNEKGYIIEKNNFTVVQSGGVCAICRKIDFGLFGTYPIITTDIFFDMLSDNGKSFVLLHEIGHFSLGHLNNTMDNKRNEELEFDADRYAVDHIGKVNTILALQELLSLIKKASPFYKGEEEFIKRIEKIKAL